MSTVSASSSNNPYTYLQPQRRQGSAAQSDSQSQQFPVSGPQAVSAVQSTNAAVTAPSPSGGAASTSSGTFPRFEPQTLQALLALQMSGN